MELTDPVRGRFYARLRRSPSASAVPGSLPVLFFGDLLSARVATVGLNPSRREYADSRGKQLRGRDRRFETLGSLDAPDRASLTDRQCDQAIGRMRSYFDPDSPTYGWFNGLERVLIGLNGSYVARSAAHVDLVQEATDPTWSGLRRRNAEEARALLDADLPFLLWELEAFPIEVVACNGRTVFDRLHRALGAEVVEEGRLARVTWWVAQAQVAGRRVALVGWNLPLARAGLGAEGEKELGRQLGEQVRELGAGTGHRQRSLSSHAAVTTGTGGAADFRTLVQARSTSIRDFLSWAAERERKGASLRHEARRDIRDAQEAAGWFAEAWWGLVVFSCFGSLRGTETVKEAFAEPRDPAEAERLLDRIDLPPGAIGHHRIRPGHKGAEQALTSACLYADDFRRILLEGDGFDDRYQALRGLRATQWGRTTCFDLLLRAGAIGIGGSRYAPDRAYLQESIGPQRGFQAVWGTRVRAKNAEWCEWLLREWTERWFEVAEKVGVPWDGNHYQPADFENALCIYREQGSGAVSPQRTDCTAPKPDVSC